MRTSCNNLALLILIRKSIRWGVERAVIVCVCNALREKQVRAKARACGGSVGQVYASLGCKPQCCQCLPFAREVIRDERNRAA